MRSSADLEAPLDEARLGQPRRYLGFVGLVLLGISLRVWLLASPLGFMNSDEAMTGIQARELFRGHGWILVPGNAYGGNVEAWLDAPLAAIFGLSALRNKVEVEVLWLLAALVLALGVRHLGRVPAAAAFAVVWIPAAPLVFLSTLAYPGYPAGLLASCGVVALAGPLIDHPQRTDIGQGAGLAVEGRALGRPLCGPARALAIGALAGLAVWMHPLYGWVCATSVIAVAWQHRRRPRTVIAPLFTGGALALTPVVIANLRHDLPTLRFRGPADVTYADRVHAWITDLYPRAVGAKWLGPRWIHGGAGQGLYVLFFVVLVATCLAVLAWSPMSGKVAAATLLLAPFTMTLLSSTVYTLDGRYAVMVLPVGGVVLAHGVALLPTGSARPWRMSVAVAVWTMLAVVMPFTEIGSVAERPGLDQLVAFLDARHITAIRADYWLAYRIVVRTNERIAASPIVTIKFDRYEERVRRADTAAGGGGVLVIKRPDTAAYLAGAPPFDVYPQFRDHQRVNVSLWTVFLPNTMPPDTTPPDSTPPTSSNGR